jgi:hypothetical protein
LKQRLRELPSSLHGSLSPEAAYLSPSRRVHDLSGGRVVGTLRRNRLKEQPQHYLQQISDFGLVRDTLAYVEYCATCLGKPPFPGQTGGIADQSQLPSSIFASSQTPGFRHTGRSQTPRR